MSDWFTDISYLSLFKTSFYKAYERGTCSNSPAYCLDVLSYEAFWCIINKPM